MPFKSQAQRRKFAALLVEGKISPETFEEWNRETGGATLPERVSTARKRPKPKAKTKTRRGRTAARPKAGARTRPKSTPARKTRGHERQ
jgi:hypothetical protein